MKKCKFEHKLYKCKCVYENVYIEHVMNRIFMCGGCLSEWILVCACVYMKYGMLMDKEGNVFKVIYDERSSTGGLGDGGVTYRIGQRQCLLHNTHLAHA